MPLNFIAWHYSSGIKKFLSVWKNFIEFYWKYFSVGPLFRTLFSPWRRDITKVRQRGLHPVLWIQSFIMNVFARMMGSIVKTLVIFFALFLEGFAMLFGFILLLVWILLPIALIAGLAGFFYFPAGFLWMIIFLTSALFFIISLLSFKNSGLDYYSLSLRDLASLGWFRRVWDRMGVDPEGINLEMLEDKNLLNSFLVGIDLSENEFDEIIRWETHGQVENEKKRKFWLRENLLAKRPIGKNWTFAYTVNLDRYAADLSEYDSPLYRNEKLIGKEKDLEELKLLLSRPNQNKVILVGETGVGKDTIVRALAREIISMKAGPNFNKKRILGLDIKEIMSSAENKNNVAGTLNLLFSEAAYAGNIILFIKDIHQYLKTDPESQEEDISAILSAFLPHPDFQIIGTTTPSEFHSNIEKKTGVMKFFDKILIGEMNPEDTMKVLMHKLKPLENDRVIFTYQGLRELIKLSQRYISDSPFPEKALDVMEEVLLFWSNGNPSPIITPAVVDEAVSSKIKVPLGEISEDEGDKLMNLEKILHRRVIGQEFAIEQISQTMRRARAGMANDEKPLGSFLFLGPTGVGKTESSKALAEAYFGAEDRMIRLDMSEYQTPESIDRLMGSAATGKEGYLINKVKESPYSILLLDEVEKANPNILNLFLQVLDEGYLTDAFGKKISFRNLIIIATSNAGSEVIMELIQKEAAPSEIQQSVTEHVIKQGIFRPELLNRFEGVIFFHPLKPDDILKITELLLKKYAEELKEQKNIFVQFDPQLVKIIAEKAFDPVFGARAINRFIQDRVGDTIVKKMISGNVKKGESFTFELADLGT